MKYLEVLLASLGLLAGSEARRSLIELNADGFPVSIDFQVTYRDFLPAACLFTQASVGVVDDLTKEYTDAWNVASNIRPLQITRCGLLVNSGISSSSDTIWNQAFATKAISGHPDFEAETQFINQRTCLNSFPVDSCVNVDFKRTIPSTTLVTGDNGLPKMTYCLPNGVDTDRCGFVEVENGNGALKQTQTIKKFFDLWYVDNPVYNKRVGQKLTLDISATETGQYSFSSDGDNDSPEFGTDPNLAFFGPLARFKNGAGKLSTVVTSIDDILDLPAWPQSFSDANPFWMTTELHTTFEFRDSDEFSMTFEFSGDDDFWAYINGQMVLDLGGLHPKVTGSIDLKNKTGTDIATTLGLVDGNVYTLDIFHAERNTFASNFAITTTLFPACNVIISGTESFNTADSAFDASKFASVFKVSNKNEVTFSNNGGNKIISLINGFGKSTFLYTAIQENVARGFRATFEAQVSGNTNGFAFVLQAQGLTNYPFSGGEKLNFAGLNQSLAVVFNLCTEGVAPCDGQEVSIHYPGSPSDKISVEVATRKKFDSIVRNLKRNEFFPVDITFFGTAPPFLEVSINESLYLRESNINLQTVLGSSGAHVGLTAATGSFNANIKIRNYALSTVEVEPANSALLDDFIDLELQEVVADGQSLSTGFGFSTADKCDDPLQAGSLGGLISSLYIEQRDLSTGLYFDNSTTPAIVAGSILDIDDGNYTVQLKTTVPGNYSLFLTFGDGCSLTTENVNVTGSFDGIDVSAEEVVVTYTGSGCFSPIINNNNSVALATPVLFSPTASPVAFTPPAENDAQIATVAGVAGGIVFLGLLAGLVMLRYRRKWNREKRYIETGHIYKNEINTKFDGADEYTKAGTALLLGNQEILELQAQAKIDPQTEKIAKLKAENEQMKEVIKQDRRKIEQPTGLEAEDRKAGNKKRNNKIEF